MEGRFLCLNLKVGLIVLELNVRFYVIDYWVEFIRKIIFLDYD